MAQAHRVSNRSILVAALSTVVEWYDFTLYLYFATVLSRVFFGGGEASLAATLGGFAVAYLMRPVGAVVFGHIGDRTGRRPMLLLSMAVMSGAMLATALLPTHAQIGPAAATVADMAEHHRADRTHQVGDREPGERRQQRGFAAAEEHPREHGGEVQVEREVVPLDHRRQRRDDD